MANFFFSTAPIATNRELSPKTFDAPARFIACFAEKNNRMHYTGVNS